jgi:hypothetical protein
VFNLELLTFDTTQKLFLYQYRWSKPFQNHQIWYCGEVVDGATGKKWPAIDAALLLSPSWLPAGYRFVREGVESGIDLRE